MEQTESGGVQAPLVFQCATCRRIIGDSFSFVASDADLRIVALQTVSSSCTRSVKPQMVNTDGKDFGCTYLTVSCPCGLVIGRVYRTTPPELDHLRNAVSLDTARLTSYELGSGQESSATAGTDSFSLSRAEQEIMRMMELLVGMDERLSRLESVTGVGAVATAAPIGTGAPSLALTQPQSQSQSQPEPRTQPQPAQTPSSSSSASAVGKRRR